MVICHRVDGKVFHKRGPTAAKLLSQSWCMSVEQPVGLIIVNDSLQQKHVRVVAMDSQPSDLHSTPAEMCTNYGCVENHLTKIVPTLPKKYML